MQAAGSRRGGEIKQRRKDERPSQLAVVWCERRGYAVVDVQGEDARRSGESCRGRVG